MIRSVFMILLLPLAVTAAEPTVQTTTAVEEFRAAYRVWDGDGFDRAATHLADAPKTALNLYWRGVIEFHQLLFLMGEENTTTNRRASAKVLKSAVTILQDAVEHNPEDGESRALLSAAYGLSIGAHPLRALWLGPRLVSQEKQAQQLDPKNPRILYLAGLNRYYGPALLGGKEETLKLLLAAEKEFATEADQAVNPLEPRWGRGACLVYLGRTYAALGETTKAESFYRWALKMNPNDKLAREELEKQKK